MMRGRNAAGNRVSYTSGKSSANPEPVRIRFDRGDGTMPDATYENVEDLAFAHWQYNANEKAYAGKLITKRMYEFARDELRKTIDLLSKSCYSVYESG